jgi:hypothetical protein
MRRILVLTIVPFAAVVALAGPAEAGVCRPTAKIIDTPSGPRWHDGRWCTPTTTVVTDPGTIVEPSSTTSTSTVPASTTSTTTTSTTAPVADVEAAPAVRTSPRFTG